MWWCACDVRSISHVKQRYKANKLRSHFGQLPLPQGAMDLLEKMLCMDPKKRISAVDAYRVGTSCDVPCTLLSAVT